VFEDGSGKLKVHQGKVHTYLGMKLDFSTKHQVKILMVKYVKELIPVWEKAAPKFDNEGFKKVQAKSGQKKKTSAAPDNRFKINEDSEKLTTLQAMAFITFSPKPCIWLREQDQMHCWRSYFYPRECDHLI
jgi:hypothetical protein